MKICLAHAKGNYLAKVLIERRSRIGHRNIHNEHRSSLLQLEQSLKYGNNLKWLMIYLEKDVIVKEVNEHIYSSIRN